jgi:UDPglucose--hexose-1-phosphate uridylyltransferase
MPELRFNNISREWVIIATERAKRPEDFVKTKKEKSGIPAYKENCPFCVGNENQTPPEVFRLGDNGKWRVRVVPNKFGALSSEGEKIRKGTFSFPSMSGVGLHEVIVEHPNHNAVTCLMTDEEVVDIIRTYKSRYESIKQDKRIEAIIIFKNHGPAAGCSLEHTHSQLIATPIVPPQIRTRLSQAVTYYDFTGECMCCKALADEMKAGDRIILETKHFVAFIPFAALSPFHTWIFPKRHAPSFGDINEEEIKDLAINLKTVLKKIYVGLDDPDFNYTIRSVPIYESAISYSHWYLNIIPRVTQIAGFEIGSGMFINIALPEKSAEFLRNIKV